MPLPPRVTLVTALAVLLVGGGAIAPALGHSDATTSSPAAGAVVNRVPDRMTVTFGDPIGRLGAMTVTRNGAGNLVRSARVSPSNARVAVIALKRPGPKKRAGSYRLTWRITGADGHVVTGVVTFRVRP